MRRATKSVSNVTQNENAYKAVDGQGMYPIFSKQVKDRIKCPMMLFGFCKISNWDILLSSHLHIWLFQLPRLSVHTFECFCWKLAPILAFVSQNVTNKSNLLFVKSEKFAVWVTLRASQSRVTYIALLGQAKPSYVQQNSPQCLITAPVLVSSNCVRQDALPSKQILLLLKICFLKHLIHTPRPLVKDNNKYQGLQDMAPIHLILVLDNPSFML